MREVTVYTVHAHQTWGTHSHAEYFEQVQMPPLIGVGDDGDKTFILPKCIPLPKRIALPVHHINRRVMSADGVQRRRDEFLAIDRDLLRVMEIVVRSNADELRQEVADLREENAKLQAATDELNRKAKNLRHASDILSADLDSLESRQDAFKAAPLWRRLWIAIRPRQHFT